MGQDTTAVSRRTFLAGTGAAAAALLLPKTLPTSRSDWRTWNFNKTALGSGTTLNIVLNQEPIGLAHAESFLSEFTKSTGIKINLSAINAGSWVNFFQAVSTKLAGGEALDSVDIATEGMLLFEERGALDPLDSYIAKDKAAIHNFYDDVDPHFLSLINSLENLKGHTYFIPVAYNVMSMWINRLLFKQYGVPEPSPDWTWDDFEKAAAKIASAPNRYGYAINTPVPGPFTDVYPWALTAGGAIMNANQTKCVANNPGAIQAATFVRGLVTKRLANEPPGAYNAITELAGGKLAMAGGGQWFNTQFPLSQAQINKQFMIVPWPTLVRSGSPVGYAGYPILKGSRNKEALWEFIKWTTTDQFATGPLVPFTGGVPMRKSIATSQSFLKQWPPGTEYFTKELSYSTIIVGVPNAGAVESEISTAWEQVLTGATSPAAGMKTMQDTCNTLMNQPV